MIARTYHHEFVLVTVQGRKGQPVKLIEETEVTFTGDQHSQETENERGDRKEQKIKRPTDDFLQAYRLLHTYKGGNNSREISE